MRWIVGALLITAAFLKAIELYSHPSSVLVDSFSRFLVPLLIGGELGLGLTAIAGHYWPKLRPLAMILFAGFACYSLLLAFQGAASCGCFGQLKINPWWTFLLDTVVLAGLFLESLRNRSVESAIVGPSSLNNKTCLVGTTVVSLAVTIGLGWYVYPQQTTAENGFQTVGDLVILEPENWPGKDFPLLDYINMDVSQGNWVLLFHRYDCPKCQEARPKYEQLAMRDTLRQVAMIEVPPYDNSHEAHASPCPVAQLSDERDWFIQTPIEINLIDGVVENASAELPYLKSSSVTSGASKNIYIHTSLVQEHQHEKFGDSKL